MNSLTRTITMNSLTRTITMNSLTRAITMNSLTRAITNNPQDSLVHRFYNTTSEITTGNIQQTSY
ncbi:hypothetical protein E2C01_084343 [Portunus trituberculatus]|uniref:Uncharacterized protein n=1 Tax=Portunus trituberculatus TaxID=210409 RepID=A0A5B7J8Z5_PORTR|nr:hypothetical protein [Portunus trituberculatus]